jgi:inorganic pyrophosphatase
MDKDFFNSLQKLIDLSVIKIDRPKNSVHPRFPEVIYPFDHGYLEGTSASDGDAIDVWVGSMVGNNLSGVIAVCDLMKKDTELKLLIGCTEEDIKIIVKHHRRGDMTATLLGNV